MNWDYRVIFKYWIELFSLYNNTKRKYTLSVDVCKCSQGAWVASLLFPMCEAFSFSGLRCSHVLVVISIVLLELDLSFPCSVLFLEASRMKTSPTPHFPLVRLLIFDSLLKGSAALENFFTYMLKEQIFGDWKNMSILISIYWEKMPPFFSHGRWLFPHVSIECKPHKPQSCVTVSHKTSSCSSSGYGVCRGGRDIADPQCLDDSCGTFHISFPVNLAEAN